MGLLAFLTAALFIPGFSGGATAPRIALLSVAVPLLISGRPRLTLGHLAAFAMLGWGTVTLMWAADVYGGLKELWALALFVGLFCIGAELRSLRGVWIGLALGLGVSSFVAIAQYFFAVDWVVQLSCNGPCHVTSGLFINPNFMAEAAVLVFLALLIERLYWLVPLVLPAAVLPQARGALLAFIVGLVVWTKSRIALAFVLVAIIGGAALSYHRDPALSSVKERFAIWADAASGLSVFGRGIGSFYVLYPSVAKRTDTLQSRPDHAHNEVIESVFEFGIGAAILLGLVVFAIRYGRSPSAIVVLSAFCVEAMVGFPLHLPVTMFIVALVAGHLSADGPPLRLHILDWRVLLRRRRAIRTLRYAANRRLGVPA